MKERPGTSRKISWLALLLTVLSLMLGCGSDGTSVAGSKASISGVVVDSSNVPLAGVTVTTGGQTTTTIADGKFTFTVPPGNNNVSLTKANYVNSGAMLALAANQTYILSVTLQKVGNSAVIVTNTSNTVIDKRADGLNASVSFSNDSIVDSSGALVPTATVAITTILPGDSGFANSFPGQFMGISTSQTSAGPIESFGYVDVEITDASGAKLQLASGKTALLVFPVNPANDPGDPSMPLWSLDPVTRIWKQEGFATRVAGPSVSYVAQVTHFSPYNLDKPILNTGPLEITVVEYDGTTPVPGVTVTVKTYDAGTSGLWKGSGISGANGKLNLTIPQAGNPNIEARLGDRFGYAGSISGGKVTVTMEKPLTYLQLTVAVVDNVGVAVQGAEVIVSKEGMGGISEVGRGTTGSDGKFILQAPDTFLLINAAKGTLKGSQFVHSPSLTPTVTVTMNPLG